MSSNLAQFNFQSLVAQMHLQRFQKKLDACAQRYDECRPYLDGSKDFEKAPDRVKIEILARVATLPRGLSLEYENIIQTARDWRDGLRAQDVELPYKIKTLCNEKSLAIISNHKKTEFDDVWTIPQDNGQAIVSMARFNVQNNMASFSVADRDYIATCQIQKRGPRSTDLVGSAWKGVTEWDSGSLIQPFVSTLQLPVSGAYSVHASVTQLPSQTDESEFSRSGNSTVGLPVTRMCMQQGYLQQEEYDVLDL